MPGMLPLLALLRHRGDICCVFMDGTTNGMRLVTGWPTCTLPLEHRHFATAHYVTSILQNFLLRVKVKIKHHFLKAYGEKEVCLHTCLTTVLDGREWLSPLPSGCVSITANLVSVVERFLLLLGIEPDRSILKLVTIMTELSDIHLMRVEG
jgi:hypothetical protein